jgi:hypothetical protein
VDGISLTEAQGDAQLRLACLDLALRHQQSALSSETVYDVAEDVYRWATKRTPSRITVAVGDVTRQQPQQEDQPMQIHDNEQFDVTVEVDDAKGFAISGDALTVTSADESVATVQPGADGVTYTIVAGNPGSTVITFDAGTDDNGNQVTATEAVDVVPGNVATIKLTEGAATTQGSAPAQGDASGAATEPGPDPTASQSV